MSISRVPITNKRLCCSVVVTVSLFFVFLGMSVPNLSRLHSPKPRPRAVVESTSKASQAAGPKVNVDVVTCQITLALSIPTPFRSSFQQEICTFNFIPIEYLSARAPPAISA